LVLVALALAVLGCGGGDTTTTTAAADGGAATTAAPTGTTGEKVRLGACFGFTGDMGPWAEPAMNAVEVAAEEVNAAGGVLGSQIELVSEDNKSTVEGGIQAANKLINVDKVSTIIGPESDPIMAMLDIAKESKTPIISTSAGTSALDEVGGKGNFIYRTNSSDSFISVAEAKIVLDELGVNEVVVMHENTEGSTSGADDFKRNFEAFGGKVLDTIVLTSGQAKYSTEIKKAAEKNPKLVYLSAGQQAAIAVLKDKYEMGYDWQIMGAAELNTPDTVKGAGVNASKGLMTTTVVEKEGTASWDRFVELYQTKFNEAPTPGYYQSNAYDAVILTALAMEAAKSTSGESVDGFLIAVSGPPGTKVTTFADGVAELKKGNEIDYDGASGPVDMDEFGNVSGAAVALMRVDDAGQWVTDKVIDSSSFPTG